jgi:hypothetical protein
MVRTVEPEAARASKALWASAAFLSAKDVLLDILMQNQNSTTSLLSRL